MRRRLAATLALLAVLLAALLPTGPLAAHALLVAADPPVNSRLREPPSVMTLYFSEGLERRISGVRVLNADGERFDTGVEFDDRNDALMRVNLRPMPPGYYTVAWETLSKVDGHRITGSYPITVLNLDGTPPRGSPPAATGGEVGGGEARAPRVVVKLLLLVGGAAIVGALAFASLTLRLSWGAAGLARGAIVSRALVTAGAGLALVAGAGIAELLLQAHGLGGVGEAGFLLNETRWGERWLLRNLLLLPPLALALVLAWRNYRRGRDSALLFLPGLAIAGAYLGLTATTSHTAAGVGSFWGVAADFVHLSAASVWIGMLLQLALLFAWSRRRIQRAGQPALLASALQRFSFVAAMSVALLLLTGTVNALITVNAPGDLLASGYGRALLLKLALVTAMLAVGGLNAYLFRPEVVVAAEADGRPSASGAHAWLSLERTLSRTLRWEAALGIAILAVAALLVQVPPARGALAAPDAREGKFVMTRDAADLSATLVVDPGQPGLNTFEVYLAGAVETVERVRLNFERAAGDPFPAQLVLEASNPPTFYVGQGPFLGTAGRWRVTVDIQRSRGTDLLISFPVMLGGGAAEREGGAFDPPRPLSARVLAVLALSTALSLAVVLGSLPTRERPFGFLADVADVLADAWDRINPNPGFALAGLLLLGIGLGLLLGAHGHRVLTGEEARGTNPVEASPASIERGRMLFIQNCIQCHGETGRGDGPLAASLPLPPANLYDHVPFHPDQFFFSVISRGVGGIMPAFGNLSEEDRWHLVNFLRDQFGQPPAVR